MEQSLWGEKSRKMVCRSEQKWYKREWPEKNKRNEPENNNKEGAEKKEMPVASQRGAFNLNRY